MSVEPVFRILTLSDVSILFHINPTFKNESKYNYVHLENIKMQLANLAVFIRISILELHILLNGNLIIVFKLKAKVPSLLCLLTLMNNLSLTKMII